MDLLRIAARVANSGSTAVLGGMANSKKSKQSENTTVITSYYVDWEGRGYTPEMWAKDRATLVHMIGDGPFFAGGATGLDQGYFFAITDRPADEAVLELRGGQKHTHDPDVLRQERDTVRWQRFADWAAFEKTMQSEDV